MFTDLLNYSGIVTKTKAMEARLITPKDFEDISALTSVTEFINFLKGKPAYQNIFANCDERLLHRNEIEHLLMNSLYLDYAKLFRFANRKQRESLSLLFYRYEVNILKSCLQNVFTSDDTYDLSMFEPFFAKHSPLNIRNLAGSKNMDEFISYLKGTKYYDLFHKIQQNGSATLHEYEVQLDISYYINVWKLRKQMAKDKDLKAFTDVIGKEIDFLNIMWIYRFKKYYDVDSSHIYSYIIPIHYKLSSAQLMKLIEASSLEEFVSTLGTTYYHTPEVDTKAALFTVENVFHERMIKFYRENRRKYPVSMCTIQHFLFMKELEIDRLTTALECIRYGLDSSNALTHILK